MKDEEMLFDRDSRPTLSFLAGPNRDHSPHGSIHKALRKIVIATTNLDLYFEIVLRCGNSFLVPFSLCCRSITHILVS